MANFEINGKEHELKLTFKAVKYLDKQVQGGSTEVVGKAFMGDMEMFPHIVYAALLHTGEGYTLADVEKAIEDAVEAEKLDANGIMRICNEVVAKSFFYKTLVAKLLKDEPEALAAIEKLTE